MTDLKHLGFVVTLATYVQGLGEKALAVYATGRSCLPGVADKVVQSAEDAGVVVYKSSVKPVVSKAGETATGLLEWVDGQLDQRYVFAVEYYESSKSYIAEYTAQLKDTHSGRLDSFVKSREAVSGEFETITQALKEKGIWGAASSIYDSIKKYLGYAVDAMKAGTGQASQMSQLSATMDYAKKLWSKIVGSSMATAVIENGKDMFMPTFLAYMDYLKKLPNMLYDAAAGAAMIAKAPLNATAETANALVDYVVASPYYAKAAAIARGYITWAQNSAVGQKVISIASPYAMPFIEKIEKIEFVHGIVERLTAAAKTD